MLLKSDYLLAAHPSIADAVKSLGPETTIEHLKILRRNPKLAVGLLVKQLEVISEKKILSGDRQAYPREMRVVWSIRALRYLTSLDFKGNTDYRFEKNEDKDRTQFLHMSQDGRVAFFGMWMSRDSIYIAPKDAQQEIIKKWNEWTASTLNDYKFPVPRDIDFWYF